MISGTSRIGNKEVHGRYLSGKIPVEIAENLKDFFPEHADVSIEEVVAEQESAYHYIQTNGKKNDNNSSTSSQARNVNQSSRDASFDSQLALDEALARSLELGDDFEGLCVNEHHRTMAGRRESTPTETPSRVMSQNPRQDDIDPDNMTYEELQSLGDAVGHESKGLSEDLICRLPTFKYKTGFFSKKKKKEECVICCSEYKSGVRLTTLPCAHQYHMECIKRWLKLNKNCPVCQVEVRDD